MPHMGNRWLDRASLCDVRILFVVWAPGNWKVGKCDIVLQVLVCMLTLSFFVSVLL